MKTFVLGDQHGNHKGTVECFDKSGIDKEKDTLIVLGDIVDGYPDVKECFNEVLKFKNLIYIKGNHDCWFEKWVITSGEFKDSIWTQQGGISTIESYGWWDNVPKEHLMLIANAPYYYVDDKNRVFVHGGVRLDKKVEDTDIDYLMWDRDLYFFMKRQHSSKSYKKYSLYDEIYIGHTQTDSKKPDMYCNLINMDSGAGWNGCVSIMDIDTKEWWSSDVATRLYPDGNGRY